MPLEINQLEMLNKRKVKLNLNNKRKKKIPIEEVKEWVLKVT